ncbi:TetR/AcrR family transcriptional regulator [Microbispora sp. KK1-11]|uniref:TetR/AcrR family transcriptional regulator n=1 Tax=Microbispora sp. KK1-11 TaxID=2053005 RepID=UPI00115B9208|nr:TetR/AcrR family transcriptional regulator [Microbispora sp. KK1-11]TQS27174.1 TetR/AcrR family transcriptional regulator [Microbispora sp. KK1-11]
MEKESKPRQRAPRQSVEERRAMVVQAAIPLLVEIGPSVTTLQIARAAGISEPTIFRAFADKNEVLAACLAEVTDPRHVVGELAAIDPSEPLRTRLIALIEVLRAQGERTAAVVNAVSLATQARPRESLSEEDRTRFAASRTASYERLHAAAVAVLEPDAAGLRTPVETAAGMVLAIVMALGRGGGWQAGAASVTTEGLADLILHGVLASPSQR